jgi:hypothetical protein
MKPSAFCAEENMRLYVQGTHAEGNQEIKQREWEHYRHVHVWQVQEEAMHVLSNADTLS